MAPLWPLILVAASGILAIHGPHPRNYALYRLTKQLLQKYRKEVRPVHDWMEATMVYLDVFVCAVLDVDAQNQNLKTNVWYHEVWDDEFLLWNSSMFDDIKEISLPLSAIWVPDIIINEFQLFLLFLVEDVNLDFLRSREDMNDSEWELSVSSTNLLQSSAGDVVQIQFHVVIRQHPLVYVVSLLIPSIFLMLVDLGSFYIPPTCRARVVFKTSVLVGYAVFRVNMSDKMPQSAVSTPLIGVFFTVCMAFLVLSLSKSILLVKFLHDEKRGAQERPLLCLCEDTDADGLRVDPGAQLVGVTESPVRQECHTQSGTLKEVMSQLQSISNYFQTQDQADQQEAWWLALLERFDRLLFQGYLVVLGLYTVTLCSLWAQWSCL
ncbi:LOW QUALITY PROTEIN: 5-hydroxytryptamine receptor 3B [Rhynchonycteris naso]